MASQDDETERADGTEQGLPCLPGLAGSLGRHPLKML